MNWVWIYDLNKSSFRRYTLLEVLLCVSTLGLNGFKNKLYIPP